MPTSLSPSERASLLDRHRAARIQRREGLREHAAALGPFAEAGIDKSNKAFVDTEFFRKASAAYDEMVELESDYFRRLPHLAMAACPICGAPLYRSFDPFGIDGFWWRSDATPDEPAACPHFCLLQGAVALTGTEPPSDFDVHPGPGAPFVLPRLLAMPGMIAVVSEIPMATGSLAYPIAYFAPRRPPVQTLAASWARTNFVYTTQLGEHAWRRWDEPPAGAAPDVPDFDLGPWVASGRVRWCEPGTDRTTLSAASACPFLNRPGVREYQVVPANERS